jgi:hypothetical protein
MDFICEDSSWDLTDRFLEKTPMIMKIQINTLTHMERITELQQMRSVSAPFLPPKVNPVNRTDTLAISAMLKQMLLEKQKERSPRL